MVQQADVLPRLADLPPGPELAAALTAIDPDALAGKDALEVLRGWSRQRAYVHARMLRTVAAVARRSRAATRAAATQHPRGGAAGEWAGVEIAAALTWTEAKATREVDFAETLIGRLPEVMSAFEAGLIDHGKAWVFVDVLGVAELTQAQIARICAVLVPVAPRLTTGQLRQRLNRAVLRVDPEYLARRYRRAVRERGVYGYLAADGSGVIIGSGLRADEAAAACERVDELVAAARRAGHPAPARQLAADVFLRLLDGRFTGMTRDEVIAALLTDPTTHPEADTAPDGAVADETGEDARTTAGVTDTGSANDSETDSGTTSETAADSDAETGSETETGGATGAGSATGAAGEVSAENPEPAARAPRPGPADTEPWVPQPGGRRLDGEPTAATRPACGRETDSRPAHRCGGPGRPDRGRPDDAGADGGGSELLRGARMSSAVEVRVGLTTLLGWDEHPGEVPGWGPVLADVARALVGRQRRAEWRFAITDREGRLLLAGVTRRRPGRGTGRQSRGGVVEFHVPAAVLPRLAGEAHRYPEWAGVIADVIGRYARRAELQAGLDAHPDRRFARAALRRHVQVRDRTCVAPCCGRPAVKADADHTRDHSRGGATVAGNTGPLCLRHHVMKHLAGWHLEQPEPGRFRWTSPLGGVYHTRGEPIDPALPGPVERCDDEVPDEPGPSRYADGPTFDPTPRGNPPPPPRPPPPPDHPDERPPF